MLLRWIMKGWIRAALWLRFRKISFVFHAPVPMEGAAILAGNHQNAILDSMTLASTSPRIPHTLSRASLFDNRLAAAFLEMLRMIPVYRFRDGFGKMRKNAEVFEQFVRVLENDEWLLIFPEGSHELRYTLRRLQKGISRIAFAAQTEGDWKKEIPIIPVGFHYESHTALGSRLLIQFGPPVSSLALKDIYVRNPREAERILTGKVFDALKPLLILPPTDEEEYDRAALRLKGNRGRFQDLMEQFRSDEEILAARGDPAPAPVRKKNGLLRMAAYALSLPGFVLHLPVILVTLGIEKAFVRDAHVIPASRFVTGVFLTPVWYLGAVGLWHMMFGSFAQDLLLLVAMPWSLWLWSRCWHWTW